MSRRVAVVTGASRGLGAALADALAARGFSVAGLASTRANPHRIALYRVVDIAEAFAVDEFAGEVAARLGAIDVWINNAAVLGPIGPLRDANYEDCTRAVAVNLMGVIAGTRAFLPRRSESAVLVNVASRAGVGPAPGVAVYAATKAGVISLTESLAAEERARGLRAYAVLPPSFDTDMQARLLRQDSTAFPGVVDARRRRSEGRVAAAEAVAERVLSEVLDGTNDDVVVNLTGD